MSDNFSRPVSGGIELPASTICHIGANIPNLMEWALKRGEGRLGSGGALLVKTGKFTGRSPKNKYIVETDEPIWRDANQSMSHESFETLWQDISAYLAGREIFVQDLVAGADPNCQVHIRVATEFAWHSLFIRHLLRDIKCDRRADYLIIDCPNFIPEPKRHGCNSESVVAINFEKRAVIIAGTGYAGEIKKSVFTIMNRILPEQGVMSMHCSANHTQGDPDDTAIFFGLSGTGKTTLSSVSGRVLIGDDEHGWSSQGVFNIEGGCYAKTFNLDPEAEPEIYGATSKFGTIIENMGFDSETCELDFSDSSITENTRCAYPIDSIPHSSASGMAGPAKHVFMLTCDAFGVLPPIARLTADQAIYHFLSGFTAKVAGTEQGISDPTPVFSACFGHPFLPLHPKIYGDLLRKRIEKNQSQCWLVNTGWSGGGYGVGQRMPIGFTRALLAAALNGRLDQAGFTREDVFGLQIPIAATGVPHHLLLPKRSWQDQLAYDHSAGRVKSLFAENFRQFTPFFEDIHRSTKL